MHWKLNYNHELKNKKKITLFVKVFQAGRGVAADDKLISLILLNDFFFQITPTYIPMFHYFAYSRLKYLFLIV